MLQNKCNNECNTAEVVNDLVAAVDKLEAKVFKLSIELDKLMRMFEGVAQNERHIETLADSIIRDKLDKALDDVSDKLKTAILEKIEKQSALW